MTIATKAFQLKSILACAALVLVFTVSQSNTALALMAAVNEDTPGATTVTNNLHSPNASPTYKSPQYKSNVATQISNAIAIDKAKALSKQQARDKEALAKVDNANRMIDDARKSGVTDEAIRSEFSKLYGKPQIMPHPPVPMPATKPPVVSVPPVLNPNQKYMLEHAKEMGWSEETLQKELAAMSTQ